MSESKEHPWLFILVGRLCYGIGKSVVEYFTNLEHEEEGLQPDLDHNWARLHFC